LRTSPRRFVPGNFSDGLSAHEKSFDRLYVNMVKAGEAAAVLDTVLERLAVFIAIRNE
jgi:type IV pilus assembly protein PilC